MRSAGALKEQIKPFLCYPSRICTKKAVKHITKLRAATLRGKEKQWDIAVTILGSQFQDRDASETKTGMHQVPGPKKRLIEKPGKGCTICEDVIRITRFINRFIKKIISHKLINLTLSVKWIVVKYYLGRSALSQSVKWLKR